MTPGKTRQSILLAQHMKTASTQSHQGPINLFLREWACPSPACTNWPLSSTARLRDGAQQISGIPRLSRLEWTFLTMWMNIFPQRSLWGGPKLFYLSIGSNSSKRAACLFEFIHLYPSYCLEPFADLTAVRFSFLFMEFNHVICSEFLHIENYMKDHSSVWKEFWGCDYREKNVLYFNEIRFKWWIIVEL